jgi:hypothetical protein
MRIRPWVVTGGGALCALAAMGVVVATNDPYSAEPGMIWLFWSSFFLALWGFFMTVFLFSRMNLHQALWIAFLWAGVTLSGILANQRMEMSPALLGGIVFGTLILSFYLWRKLRYG